LERLHGFSRGLERIDGAHSLKDQNPKRIRDNTVKQIPMIEVSPRGKNSASRSVAETLAVRLTDLYPSAKLMRRDLAGEHLPHLDDIALRAISTSESSQRRRLGFRLHGLDGSCGTIGHARVLRLGQTPLDCENALC
jgi:hypothetical protein